MAAKILRFTEADFQTLQNLIEQLDALSTVAETATDSDPADKSLSALSILIDAASADFLIFTNEIEKRLEG